jgi:3-methyladenine DNA glycosylase AlkD
VEYLNPLYRKLEQNRNPELAVRMKKYMLNQFEFYGIQSPARKEIVREFLKNNGLPEKNDFLQVISDLWNKEGRECQYIALFILDKLSRKADKEIIDLYEDLICRKSWWDTVDGIAPSLVGTHFRLYPDLLTPYTNKWMESGNIWLQRSCILFQLKYKSEVDTELLDSFILQLNESSEFFIRKAIGWMLREYSKTNPGWVKTYIQKTPMAPLSKREGLKWLNRKTS